MASIQPRYPHHPHPPPHHGLPHHHQPTPSTYLPNGGGPMGIPPQLPQGPHPVLPLGPHPGAAGLPPQPKVIEKAGVRILCIADVRGSLRELNKLAKEANADHIIHTGDFGFYDSSSLERIADKTLRHVAQYSPLLSEAQKKIIQSPNTPGSTIKQRLQQMTSPGPFMLSELPMLLEKKFTLDVPVYTVWGACEDVRVLEKFRSQEYHVDNLHIIDEASSRLLDAGGVKLRLLGLGGALVMHKLFDNGEGKTTIAGGQGTMWTTVLQMGELVNTANRVFDPSETRIFITHHSPARDGLLNQLSVTLKADFSISAGLHFRYGSSYNEFSVNPTLDNYRGKLASSKASFNDVWETVKGEVIPAVQQNQMQQTFLDNVLALVEKMPSTANGGNPFGGGPPTSAQGQVDESAFKNMWNFNLADAAFGWLVLDIEGGKIGTEMRAQGFNFAHRCSKPQPNAASVTQHQQVSTIAPAVPAIPANAPGAPNTNSPVSPAVPTYSQATRGPARGPGQASSAQSSPRPQASEPVAATDPTFASAAPPPAGAPTEAAPSAETPAANSATNPEPKISSPGLSPASPAIKSQDFNNNRYQNIHERNQRGLYVNNGGSTAEEVRAKVFSPEDAALITEMSERHTNNGRMYWYVYFASAEVMKDILSRLPAEYKNHGDRGKVLVKEIDLYNTRGGADNGPKPGMNESRWSRPGPDSGSYSRGGGGPGMPKQGGGSNSEGEGYRGGRAGTGSGYNRGPRNESKGRGGGYGSGRGGGRGRGRGGQRADGGDSMGPGDV